MEKRINWIDTAKAIGILFVLLGHTSFPLAFHKYIYSFHMPFFFFISGMFFREGASFKNFVKNKFTRLVLPYFIIAIISYLFWLGISSFRYTGTTESPFATICSVLYGTTLISNGPLWFLPCIFVTSIGFYLLAGRKRIAAYLLGLSIIGYLYSTYIHVNLPWSLDNAMTSIVFFGAGYLLKKHLDKFEINNVKSILAMILAFILSILFVYLNDIRVSIPRGVLGNYLYFYLAAFSGIAFWLSLSKLLPANKVMSYIGRNSMIIFTFQMIVFYIISGIFDLLLKYPVRTDYNELLALNPNANPYFVALSFTIGGILLSIPIIEAINRYFPFVIGAKKPNNLL